jgi:hypothetical protein
MDFEISYGSSTNSPALGKILGKGFCALGRCDFVWGGKACGFDYCGTRLSGSGGQCVVDFNNGAVCLLDNVLWSNRMNQSNL